LAVVRRDQHVGVQHDAPSAGALQQRVHRLPLDVAGKEDRAPRDGDAHHERRVVGFPTRVEIVGRPEDLEFCVADVEPIAGPHDLRRRCAGRKLV
jgi:hypothetical protein